MQIVFVTYMNRSGSTYLCKRLGDFSDIAVTLEASFPDGIARRELVIESAAGLDDGIRQLYDDAKFASWNVAPEDLKERLARARYPIGFPDIFAGIVDIAFGSGKKAVIYKNGAYLLNLRKVRQQFPDCKVIHLIRDFRAIYASQKRSISSRTGRAMARFPFENARLYRRMANIAQRHAEAPWFHVVRYEDLVSQPDPTLASLVDFLGCSSVCDDRDRSYAASIPDAQKHLHANIHLSPLPSRIDAWREELNSEEVYAIEKICNPVFTAFGYPPGRTVLVGCGKVRYARLWIRHIFWTCISRKSRTFMKLVCAQVRKAAGSATVRSSQ